MTGIACLIATWQDGELLAEAVASASPFANVTIVLDGAYFGLNVPVQSGVNELLAAEAAGAVVVSAPRRGVWPGEIEKRNVLLELGRAFLPDVDEDKRWALVLDADELLRNGDDLREAVDLFPEDAFAPGLLRVEPDGTQWAAPSRLFRLVEDVRYFGRSYWLSAPAWSWQPVSLEHSQMGRGSLKGRPYVQHRWNKRSMARLKVQRRWGRMLAERDHGTSS